MLKSKDYPEVLIAETLAFQGFPLKLRDILFFGIRLAGKSPAQQVKLGQLLRFSVSDIFAVPLSLRVKQCAVAALSVSVQLAVSHAYKTSGSCQSLPETANAGEHIEKTDGFPFTLPSRCIFGNAHQRMGHPSLNEKSPGRR